jgi:peptidoglycan hydrolase-like protein with peptidoglycan-binding domain
MRIRSLLAFALALVALTVAACGGGLEATTTNDIFDTGEFTDTSVFEPPAVEPEPAPQSETIVLEVSAGQPIGPQSPAEQVSELQRALVALGYKVGKPDGVYGAKTRKAVVKFQKAHKLKADGLVGQKTARIMNQELAKLG